MLEKWKQFAPAITYITNIRRVAFGIVLGVKAIPVKKFKSNTKQS
jgi:hypothetical protein